MPRVRIFIIDVDDERGTSVTLTPSHTAKSYWAQTMSRRSSANKLLAYEVGLPATLPGKPMSDQEWYDRCAAALIRGDTLGDIHQCVYELQVWAIRHGVVKREITPGRPADAAPASETVVADTGPRKPPRTVIVQEWCAAMERERPGEIANRAWDALHSLIAKGS